MRPISTPVLLAIVLLSSANVFADGQEFYRKGAEGWFWYHDPEPEPEPELEEKEIPPIPAAPPKPEKSEPAEPKGPPSFSVEWFQENMEQVLNRAIDDPTEENVAAYFFIHRVMMDKANKFAVNAREVSMNNPQLDEMTRKTSGAMGVRISEQHQKTVLNQLSERLNERNGALWVWLGDDIYSKKMTGIIENLRNQTGITVVAFSLSKDGLDEETAQKFPDYVIDDGSAARRVGVTHTPAMALALPPGNVQLVSHGMIGLAQVKDRMVIASSRLELLEEDELNLYQGRLPGSDLIDTASLPDFEGNDTDKLLEVMGETFNY
jgi:conjugal transfer pilus assembly protein TraF